MNSIAVGAGGLGAALAVAAGLMACWLAHLGGYRRGPWPGLTGRGAGLLIVVAVCLVGCEAALGPAAWDASQQVALPFLPLEATLSVMPLVLVARLTSMPWTATAVAGAYLLGRSLVSLIEPAVAAPPLILVGAMALDCTLWVQARDVARLADLWPRRGEAMARWAWRRERTSERGFRVGRAVAGGLAFALTLAIVEPPFSVLLGADPSAWSLREQWLAPILASAGAAVAAWAMASAPIPWQLGIRLRPADPPGGGKNAGGE